MTLPSTVLAEVLDAASDALGDRAPERRFICAGEVNAAADCAQLTARLAVIGRSQLPDTGRADPQVPSPRSHPQVPTATIVVTLVDMCPPIGAEPADADALGAWWADTIDDGWALWQGLNAARRAGTLAPSLGRGATPVVGPLQPASMRGGAAGWDVTVSCPLIAAAP